MTFNLPKEYNNKWYIWNDKILDNLEFSDCNNSIKGYCTKNKTTKECIDSCKGNDCSYGYNVTLSNKERICANIANKGNNTNPIYRLVPKDSIDGLKNVKIDTFINKDVFPYPPNNGLKVFFQDLCNLENVKTSKVLDLNNLINKDYGVSNTKITLSKKCKHELQIIPDKPKPFLSDSTIVTFGETISLNLPSSILFMKALSDSILYWSSASISYNNEAYVLVLESLTKKDGEQINYGDEFLIKVLDCYVVYDEINNLLELTNFNKEKAINNNGVFRLKTNRKGYYCEDNICKNDSIHNLSQSDKKIYRNKDCWNLCKKPTIEKKIQDDDKSLHELNVVSHKDVGKFNYKYLLIGIIIGLIIIIIILKYF